ncbi:MAG: glycosyltransferase family 39 protein [Candidatus Daviesbacteria bacterium]|nr:glycosyltransferase family 39 protein [Candidatus Daviesbacteria bacterium]
MKFLKLFTNQYFWLGLILILGFLVRLYKIDAPIADWHSWRQADTAAVTRNFIKTGFNPLFPKYDDMSGVSEKPVINPAGFRFVEFPVYNMAVYPLYKIFGINDAYSRLVSAFFSTLSIIFIFLITKRYAGTITSLVASFVFAFLPFSVFFGRTTLPEPTFIFFALGMIYFVDSWIENRKRTWMGWGFIFTAIAFLMKPWAIFFYLPLIYSVFVKQNNKRFWIKFMIFTALALLPFGLWRLWILQHPEGIPASGWLLNGDGIRFRPAFWWWIVSERIGREILAATGMVLFSIGLISRPRSNYFLHIWALSSFLFMVVFATGNVRHNYYQTQFVPIASIFFAIGFVSLFRRNIAHIARIWTMIIALILFALSFYFSFYIVKEFYKINNPVMIEAGRKADQLLPKEAVVLAPYNGDSAFLYQTNRPGFAAGMLPIRELVSDYGVTHFVSTTRDDKTNWVLRHFQILEDNPGFVIADLRVVKAALTSEDPEP